MAAPSGRSSGTAGGSASRRSRSLLGATAGRRVQPRHFHSGPNPAAAANNDEADGGHAEGPSPAAQLYRHALESIFAFLGRGELAQALQVSCGWLGAVRSMGRLQLHVARPTAPMFVMGGSAMGRHVSSLGDSESPHLVSLIPDSLYVLASRMAHLQDLDCELKLPPSPTPLAFPAALRKLYLSIPDPPAFVGVNGAIAAVGRLTQLESVTFEIELDSRISFSPLIALQRLREVDIQDHQDHESELSDAQVDQLRAMPHLQKMSVWPMRPDSLRRLLRVPHDLQWEEINLPDPLDDEAAALLPQLPSFTTIHASVSCSEFAWLRGLPHLTQINLLFDGGLASIESLTDGLQHCANMDHLSLSNFENLTAAHLANLLPRLPRLRILKLAHLSIDSLHFLAQEPMKQQLLSLDLAYCRRLPLVEMRHARALRNLERLTLTRSFSEAMDSHSPGLYAPPSLLLPRLNFFRYERP